MARARRAAWGGWTAWSLGRWRGWPAWRAAARGMVSRPEARRPSGGWEGRPTSTLTAASTAVAAAAAPRHAARAPSSSTAARCIDPSRPQSHTLSHVHPLTRPVVHPLTRRHTPFTVRLTFRSLARPSGHRLEQPRECSHVVVQAGRQAQQQADRGGQRARRHSQGLPPRRQPQALRQRRQERRPAARHGQGAAVRGRVRRLRALPGAAPSHTTCPRPHTHTAHPFAPPCTPLLALAHPCTRPHAPSHTLPPRRARCSAACTTCSTRTRKSTRSARPSTAAPSRSG